MIKNVKVFGICYLVKINIDLIKPFPNLWTFYFINSMNFNAEFPTLVPNKLIKVEKILKGSLDSIPSPSPSVKIQIMGGKVGLRCKGKTLLGVVNKLFCTKCLLTTPSNVLPLYLKQSFLPII